MNTVKKTSALLVSLLVLASPFVLTLPWQEWAQHSDQIKAQITQLGSWSAVLFVLGTAVATALGMPRLVFCVMAGWLYGFEYGFLWSQIGSLIGAYALFFLARHTRPERLMQKYPKLRELSRPAGTGWFSVLLVRQLPLAGLYNDILLAWSPVSTRDFWIGSFIGFLPLGIAASLIGAGTIQADLNQIGGYLAAGTGIFMLLTMVTKWVIKRKTGLNTDPV